MGRTLIIGDVHGCLHELTDLLDACAYSSSDSVVQVGDLVAKGPDSRGVLALVRKLGIRAVRGNHDHAVLRWQSAVVHEKGKAHGSHHMLLARELSAADWSVLTALPLFLRLTEHRVIVVHAGLVPGVALTEQAPELLMNMRTLRPDGTGSRRAEDGVLWGTAWPGPALVVFGHHATAGLQRHPHAIGLDTGCVYGGKLTAYVLPDDRFVSVEARETYAPITNGSAPRGSS